MPFLSKNRPKGQKYLHMSIFFCNFARFLGMSVPEAGKSGRRNVKARKTEKQKFRKSGKNGTITTNKHTFNKQTNLFEYAT